MKLGRLLAAAPLLAALACAPQLPEEIKSMSAQEKVDYYRKLREDYRGSTSYECYCIIRLYPAGREPVTRNYTKVINTSSTETDSTYWALPREAENLGSILCFMRDRPDSDDMESIEVLEPKRIRGRTGDCIGNILPGSMQRFCYDTSSGILTEFEVMAERIKLRPTILSIMVSSTPKSEADMHTTCTLKHADIHHPARSAKQPATKPADKAEKTVEIMKKIANATEGYAVDESRFPSADGSVSALAHLLAPTYIRALPTRDGWGNDIHYKGGGMVYTLRSPGRDGRHGSSDDIVLKDGFFTQAPEGAER